jgi:hypothetical protein
MGKILDEFFLILYILYDLTRRLFIFLLLFVEISYVIVFLFVLWDNQQRQIYCIKDELCITIWKRYGPEYYIRPLS